MRPPARRDNGQAKRHGLDQVTGWNFPRGNRLENKTNRRPRGPALCVRRKQSRDIRPRFEARAGGSSPASSSFSALETNAPTNVSLKRNGDFSAASFSLANATPSTASNMPFSLMQWARYRTLIASTAPAGMIPSAMIFFRSARRARRRGRMSCSNRGQGSGNRH